MRKPFQEVASKLEWSSKIRTMTYLVRQLEFTLLRLETRLGELLSALQQAVPTSSLVTAVTPLDRLI